MTRWVEFCKGAALLAIAAVLFSAAVCIVPAIGRAIDRSSDANEINCGAQYNTESAGLRIGFTATNTANAKGHPAAGTVDDHKVDR